VSNGDRAPRRSNARDASSSIAALLAIAASVGALGCAQPVGPTVSEAGPTTARQSSEEASMPRPTIMPRPTMMLTSPAFSEGTAIPRKHTCDGEDISPPLAWTDVPNETAWLALIVDDPDAHGFVHWVAYGIDFTAGTLAEGASGGSAFAEGRNDFGRVGYGGPCPPSGTHRYVFRLLAIDDGIGRLSGTLTATEVLAASDGHVVGEGRLTGTYRRGG